MLRQIELTATISKNQENQRLDWILAKMFSSYSRSRIKEWILDKRVLINGKIWNKPKKKVSGGEIVVINAKIEGKMPSVAQNIPLHIIYEDDSILVINKPRNMVVHPGAGNPNGTILNALLYYCPSIVEVPRAGIFHRLDKETTGLMVVAKTISAYTRLTELLQLRAITREYEALAVGHVTVDGTVNAPIKRHSTKRTRMSVHPTGKPAVTHYYVVEHFRMHTRLRLRLETGRTHQIRVHMAHIGHPLVGDQVYGNHPYLPKSTLKAFMATALRKFDRQALHATMLRLYHPITGIKMEWHAPIPSDMVSLIETMRADFEEYTSLKIDKTAKTAWIGYKKANYFSLK